MNDLAATFKEMHETEELRRFETAMSNARNTMRAVRIMVEEGDYDKAVEAINEALGETDD